MFGEDAGREMEPVRRTGRAPTAWNRCPTEIAKVEALPGRATASVTRSSRSTFSMQRAGLGRHPAHARHDDVKRPEPRCMEQMRKELPKLGPRRTSASRAAAAAARAAAADEICGVRLIGDSTESLAQLARGHGAACWRSCRSCATCAWTPATRTARSRSRVDRERAATYGFSAQEVAQYIGIALRGSPLREFRRGETEVPVWVRFAGADAVRRRGPVEPQRCAAPDGSTVPLMSLVDVNVRKRRIADLAPESPDHAGDHGQPRRRQDQGRRRARRSRRC